MMTITFERASEPQLFAHISSTSGILGHAQEIRDQVPPGTWLTLQPCLSRVGPWLVRKCGFQYMGVLLVGDEVHELLQRMGD